MSCRAWVPVLAIVALLAAALAGGCGSGESSAGTAQSTASEAEAGAAISAVQVDRAAPGTPERTVLEWWRDVQRNDPEHARGLYAMPPTLPNLAGQFNLVAETLAGSVAVIASERKGGLMVVRVRWVPVGEKTRRVTLRLAEDAGKWKLLDTRFLDELVVELQQDEGG